MPDLEREHVRMLLAMQGYAVPEDDLDEITAQFNALVEGLGHVEQFGSLQNEPWPPLVGYEDHDDR